MPAVTAPNQAPNPLRQIRVVLTSVIESVAGDIDKILSLDKDQKGNIVGKFHIADQVYDFTVTPDGKFTYDEAEKGGMRSDALLDGFYQGEWRSDAPRRSGGRRGKKCGDGYISADYECSVGLSPLMKERARSVFSVLGRTEARQQVERQQQQAPSKKGGGGLAKAAGTALTGAAIAGAGVAAAGAIAQRQKGKEVKSGASLVSQVASQVQERAILPSSDRDTALRVSAAVGLSAAAYMGISNRDKIAKITDKAVLSAAATAYNNLNEYEAIDQQVDALPISPDFKQKIKSTVGAAKAYLAKTVFEKQGATVVSIDEENNFATYRRDNGSLVSVGSVGSKVLTFGSERFGDFGGYPAFDMAFRINNQYDRKPGDRKEALRLVRLAKAAYADHLKNLPENAFLRTEAWKGDDAGEKRQSIYEKEGFRSLPIRGNHLWALKNLGSFSKIPDEQADYIAKLIKGDREDSSFDGKYLDRLDAALEMIVGDTPIATIEGFLNPRMDEKSRPGHTWVDDPRVKNGGYWRKIRGSKGAAVGLVSTALVGGAIAGAAVLKNREKPEVSPAPTPSQSMSLATRAKLAAGVATLGAASHVAGTAIGRAREKQQVEAGSPAVKTLPPASAIALPETRPPVIPAAQLPPIEPSRTAPAESEYPVPQEPMTVGEMVVRRYSGSRNLKGEDVQEAIDFISTAPGGDAAVFDLALEETPTKQKLKAAGTILRIGVQNPKIGLRLYRVGVKAAQDITYDPELASATARTLTSNPRAQRAIERAARDTFIASTATADLVQRGGRNLITQVERDTMALGAAVSIFWKEGTIRGLWGEAQEKARQRQERLGRRTDSQDDEDAVFLLEILDMLRGMGDRTDSGPTRPGFTWVDDRRVEGGGYWRKLPKRSTQIAKGVAGTAIAAAVVAGGAMALRSRQGTTPASAIAPKKSQDWRVPALGGAVAGAASAGFAVKWGTEAATKKQIERVKSEAQRLAEARIEEIRNEEGNRLSSEVARLQKEADSRLSSELEKAKAESRAEYEPQLAATEQKRIALEQEIARRERDLEVERKQSGDRHATELEKAKAELRTEYESQLSIIREEKSALERAIAQRDASLESLGRQAKSTMEEQARQSNARLEIEIARVKAEYEQSLGEKESELQKVKTSSSKEIAKLSEGLKQQQATERDRVSEGIKAGVEPAVKELEQARTQLQSDYENRVAQIQLDFENKAKEIEAGIAKEVLKRSQEAEERINADAQRQIEEGRQRSLKEAQDEIQAAEDKRLAGNTAKGSLITDDKDGIALSASIRRGMKLDEIPADSLQRRFSDAVDGLARRRLTREIASLGEDFAKRAKEIRNSSRRPAEKWRMMEEALLRQTNRENGIGGAVDDVRREFRDRHLEALRGFLAKAEGRGKFDDDLIASFDKELTRLNKEMQERIDQAVKDTLDGQPLNLPPGTRKDSDLVEERIWVENPNVKGGGYYQTRKIRPGDPKKTRRRVAIAAGVAGLAAAGAAAAVVARRRSEQPKDPVQALVEAEEDKIKDGWYEKVRVIDPQNGRVLVRKNGSTDQVALSDRDLRRAKGKILTHNHPSGGTFSIGDIATAAKNELAEVRAVTAGYRYSLKPPKGGWNERFFTEKVASVYHEEIGPTLSRFTAQAYRGRLDRMEAQVEVLHQQMERVARKTGMIYSRTPIPGAKENFSQRFVETYKQRASSRSLVLAKKVATSAAGSLAGKGAAALLISNIEARTGTALDPKTKQVIGQIAGLSGSLASRELMQRSGRQVDSEDWKLEQAITLGSTLGVDVALAVAAAGARVAKRETIDPTVYPQDQPLSREKAGLTRRRTDSEDPIQEARLLVKQAIAHTHQVQGLPTARMDDDGTLRGTFLTPDRTRLEYAIALNGTLYVDEFRSDSDSKPCGKGWISEGEECHVGKSRLPSPLRRATDKARQLIRQGNEREEKMRAKLQEKGIKLGTRTELLKEGVVAGMGYAGSVAAGPVGSVVASAGTRAVLVAGSKVRTVREAEERKQAIAEIAEETTKEMWGAIVGEVVSAGVTTAIGKSIPGVGMLPAMKTQGRLTEVTKAGVRAIARRTIKVGKGSSATEKAAPDEAAK